MYLRPQILQVIERHEISMHEFGIVVHVIDTIENFAKEHNLTKINSITLELGEVSSILPDYITDCWNWAHKKSELLNYTELKLEVLPAVSICNDCGKTYSPLEYAKKCPNCGGDSTVLLTGNEFNIKELEAC